MAEFGLDSKVVIDETIQGQNIGELKSFITDKNYPFVADQQNGQYSNQISFDLSGLASSSNYLNLQNSYLLMPMSITASSSTGWTTGIPPSAVELKSNMVNLIDSMQVFVNNKQLVDQTTMSNIPISILSKLEMSTNDLKLEGAGMSIAPDTYSAVKFSAAADTTGDGYCNNQLLAGAVTSVKAEKAQNLGAMKRNSMFTCTSTTTVADNTSNLPAVSVDTDATRAVGCQDQGLPYFSLGTVATLAATWNFIAYLPLRRLSDVFCRIPLIKNSQVRLILNLNLGSVQITHGTANISLGAINQTAGNTFPVMFNQVTETAFPTSGTTTLTLAMQPSTTTATSTKGAAGYPLLPQCRLYCQSLVIAPNYEEKILSNPVKTIRYLDWFQLPITNVAKGASYSQTISTSLPNVALAIVAPYHNGSTYNAGGSPAGNGLFTAITGNQYQSPFDAAPEQTLPLGMAAFKQLNFQINGTNVWNNNAQFTYDIFCQEVKSLSLNGSLNKELASGLMDLVDWQFSPVAICDLGDRVDAESDAYQSVVINGVNGSAVPVDYRVYIGYWKTYSINVITGQCEKIF